MQERGLLLKDRLVRATLADLKTQTRRLPKRQPPDGWNPEVGLYHPTIVDRHGHEQPGPEVYGASDEDFGLPCPYGRPGDRLWVREAWHPVSTGGVHFRADGPCGCFGPSTTGDPRWKPGIHLFRKDARILLDVAKVRVQRLQSISEADAKEEGVMPSGNGWLGPERPGPLIHTFGINKPTRLTEQRLYPTAREAFRHLWDSINKDRSSWDANPWVWVLDFDRVTP